MKPILSSLAAITIVAIPAIPAQAFVKNYSFDVEFATGDLANQTFTGMFAIEYTLGVNGAYYPAGSTEEGAGGLLSWMIEINDETFDMTDDEQFPDFPGVFFDGSPLETSNFRGINFSGLGSQSNTLEIENFNVTYNGADEGAITQLTLQSVPESSTILGLLALGSLGLMTKINKKSN